MSENKRSRLAHLDGKITGIQRHLDAMGMTNSFSMTAEDRIKYDIGREKLMIQRETLQREYRRLVRDVASEELATEAQNQSISDNVITQQASTQRVAAKLGGLSRQDLAMQDTSRRSYEERGI